MIYDKKLEEYKNNSSHIKLYYFDEEISGKILNFSEDFILIHDVKDWHYDAYMIFPKKFIKKIKYGKLEKFHEKLLKNTAQKKDNIDWINLKSFKSIFNSIHSNYNQVCIEGVEKNVNQFLIGKISQWNKKNLFLKKLTVYGELKQKEIKIPINDISCIFFKDEYSSRLFDYLTAHK